MANFPWVVAARLGEANRSEQRQILSELLPSHPFWIGAFYVMDPLGGPVVTALMGDPFIYGEGLPARAFDVLVRNILDGKIRGDDIVLGVEAISRAATAEEWTRWYKPILAGALRLPLPFGTYNEFAPEERKVAEFIVAHWTLPTRQPGTDFVIQPIPEGRRSFWLITQKGKHVRARGFAEDGVPILDEQIEAALALPGQDGLVLEGIYANGRFHAYDVITKDQLISCAPSAPLGHRLNVLDDLVGALDKAAVRAVPHVRTDRATFMDEFGLLVESGFTRFLFRLSDFWYSLNGATMLIEPTSRTILTCADVIEGIGKQAGVAGALLGRGSRGKRNVKGLVSLGLTRAERELAWSRRDSLIGKQFEVGCCGASDDDELILPVFRKWKDILWATQPPSTESQATA